MSALEKTSLKILLVEDNPGDARLFFELIGTEKVSIDKVETLADAMGKCESSLYDILLLDLGLPDSKGFDTFNKIYNAEYEIPIIVLTGNDDEELGNTLVRMGAQDFLVKGKIDQTIIQKAILYAVNRFKSQKEIENQEKQLRDIIAKSVDGMIVLDHNNSILFLNPIAKNLLSANNDELVGDFIGTILEGEDTTQINTVDKNKNVLTLQIKQYDASWGSKPAKVISLRDITELQENQTKIEHLNKLLKTIGSINHLIVNEKDKVRLLSKACELLTAGRSYNTAWIGLYENGAKITPIGHSGLDKEFAKLKKFLDEKKDLYCYSKLQECKGVVRIQDSSITCGECPIAKAYLSSGSLAVQISYEDEPLGMLVVSQASNIPYDEMEESLIAEVAADLGLAIHTIDVENRERISQDQLLWLNEAMKGAANSVILTDEDGFIIWANPAVTKLTGYTFEELIGQRTNLFSSGKHDTDFYENLWHTIKAGQIWSGEIINKKKNGDLYFEEMTITPVKDIEGNIGRFIAIKSDISDRKTAEAKEHKNRKISESLYEMSKMVDKSEEEIMDIILEKGVEFTESQGGYLHFLNDDGVTLNLFKWSKAVHTFCKAEKNSHYPLEMAGIWADCVRTRKPVIHNDYQNRTDRKGLPEGHFPLYRHMSIPVMENDKIIAVCGVGNKESNYTQDDVLTLSLFMNEMWKLISRKRATQKLKQSEERFRGIFENARIGIYRTDKDWNINLANPAFLNMLGLDTFDQLEGKKLMEEGFVSRDSRFRYKEILKSEGVISDYEDKWKKSDGQELFVRESAKAIYDEGNNLIYYEGIVVDITEARIFEDKLIVAKDRAEAMGKMKSEFLAQMSHEIRTPLNAMLSTIDFVRGEIQENLDEDAEVVFEILDTSGKRIIHTIESILNMSELQTGSYDLVPTEFALCNEIINPIVDKYAETLVAKGIKLIFNKDSDDYNFEADIYSVTQIIKNIVDNSTKFTDKGSIEISLNKKSSGLMLQISDTGIGITKEYLEYIFDPFSQESQGYSRPYDGCGLGLSITKKYCELNKIDIQIISEREKGTTVSLTFDSSLLQN